MKKIALWFATGFGLGYSPVAPGTVGTVWGVLITWLVWSKTHNVWIQTGLAAGLTLLAVVVCDVANKHFGTKDDHRICADEYMTFPFCMIGLPATPEMLVVAFFTNRILDIIKPPPAYQIQRVPGGLGIVLDDLITSLMSLGVNWLIWWWVLKG
jgi:phosphatidylglycerophosphatase A